MDDGLARGAARAVPGGGVWGAGEKFAEIGDQPIFAPPRAFAAHHAHAIGRTDLVRMDPVWDGYAASSICHTS